MTATRAISAAETSSDSMLSLQIKSKASRGTTTPSMKISRQGLIWPVANQVPISGQTHLRLLNLAKIMGNSDLRMATKLVLLIVHDSGRLRCSIVA